MNTLLIGTVLKLGWEERETGRGKSRRKRREVEKLQQQRLGCRQTWEPTLYLLVCQTWDPTGRWQPLHVRGQLKTNNSNSQPPILWKSPFQICCPEYGPSLHLLRFSQLTLSPAPPAYSCNQRSLSCLQSLAGRMTRNAMVSMGLLGAVGNQFLAETSYSGFHIFATAFLLSLIRMPNTIKRGAIAEQLTSWQSKW